MFTGRQRAVAGRESNIQGEREHNARKVDERFCGTASDSDGPVLQRLRTFGPIVGLVVGHFGEWSYGLQRLTSAAAEDAALRVRALSGARSIADARGRCAWYFRLEVAWAGINANARLKLERAEFVGWDARSAKARREERTRHKHSRRARWAWASVAYERGSDCKFARDRDGAVGG